MRGKLVNLCVGLTNIVFGLLVILYTKIVPQDRTVLTVQENNVVTYILFGIYAIISLKRVN